ncbi:MAG: tRNA (guanosine(46)-N7)-methyltransferase TrmB [Alphaproteobacteria bacterium]
MSKEYNFYGRRLGRPLSPHKKGLVDTLLPAIEVSAETDWSTLPAPIRLEIGFGNGEHIAAQAKANPDITFVGAEPFLNGVATLLGGIATEELANIRLYPNDIRDLLPHIPDSTIDRIDMLFPDPWPKKRHQKRRLAQTDLLHHLKRILKQDGVFRFATDDDAYAEDILEYTKEAGFVQTKEDIHTPPADWVSTRYERRAIKLGNNRYFYCFRKV